MLILKKNNNRRFFYNRRRQTCRTRNHGCNRWSRLGWEWGNRNTHFRLLLHLITSSGLFACLFVWFLFFFLEGGGLEFICLFLKWTLQGWGHSMDHKLLLWNVTVSKHVHILYRTQRCHWCPGYWNYARNKNVVVLGGGSQGRKKKWGTEGKETSSNKPWPRPNPKRDDAQWELSGGVGQARFTSILSWSQLSEISKGQGLSCVSALLDLARATWRS